MWEQVPWSRGIGTARGVGSDQRWHRGAPAAVGCGGAATAVWGFRGGFGQCREARGQQFPAGGGSSCLPALLVSLWLATVGRRRRLGQMGLLGLIQPAGPGAHVKLPR